MNPKMQHARSIYYMTEFRQFMRNMQGLTDEHFSRPVHKIAEKIQSAAEQDPVEMFDRMMTELVDEWDAPVPMPMNSEWHHFMVPGIIMKSLQNCGYEISNQDVQEAILRGQRFAGGSCGFMGTCGGAYSVGIVGSLIKKTNPIHDEERSDIMNLVADSLNWIAQYPRRCCKRSSYMAFEKALDFLKKNGYEKIPVTEITCRWSSQNKMCFGKKCLYFRKAR